jgi:K+-sensing histidine kinase KdpD
MSRHERKAAKLAEKQARGEAKAAAKAGKKVSKSEKKSAEQRLERSSLLKFEAFLSRRSPAFVVVLGFLLIALIGLIDAVTGSFDMAPLYILPVGLVTFSRGRWLGAMLALVATIARGAAEVANSISDLQSPVTYWSGLTRFYVFMVVVLMVGPMRDVLRWQREAADKLAETNQHLEALNELRDVLTYEDEEQARDNRRALEDLQASLEALEQLSNHAAVVAAVPPMPPPPA